MLLGNAPQSGVKATESQLKHVWKHLLQTSGKYLVESEIYYMQCTNHLIVLSIKCLHNVLFFFRMESLVDEDNKRL